MDGGNTSPKCQSMPRPPSSWQVPSSKSACSQVGWLVLLPYAWSLLLYSLTHMKMVPVPVSLFLKHCWVKYKAPDCCFMPVVARQKLHAATARSWLSKLLPALQRLPCFCPPGLGLLSVLTHSAPYILVDLHPYHSGAVFPRIISRLLILGC